MSGISDACLILATILGPVLAVQAQRVVDNYRRDKARKYEIFRTLMATRAARVSDRHVEALNLIEVEYSAKDPKQKKIIEAWRAYFDGLNQIMTEAQTVRNEDLFIDLMYELSVYHGYNQTKIELRRIVYSPQAHGNRDVLQWKVLEGTAAVFSGERPLKIDLSSSNDARKSTSKTA